MMRLAARHRLTVPRRAVAGGAGAHAGGGTAEHSPTSRVTTCRGTAPHAVVSQDRPFAPQPDCAAHGAPSGGWPATHKGQRATGAGPKGGPCDTAATNASRSGGGAAGGGGHLLRGYLHDPVHRHLRRDLPRPSRRSERRRDRRAGRELCRGVYPCDGVMSEPPAGMPARIQVHRFTIDNIRLRSQLPLAGMMRSMKTSLVTSTVTGSGGGGGGAARSRSGRARSGSGRRRSCGASSAR